jgi:hypothetical protein
LTRHPPLYFWRDATGHEIDVLVDTGGRVFKGVRVLPWFLR